MIYFAVLLALVLGALLSERVLHRRSRQAIRHRIHVNGIRGKSSVTRLIAAGLREGGVRTWAKVTGTEPNIVDEQGRDVRIRRFAGPRLSEQRAVVRAAARRGVEALVLECMALRPVNQEVSEEGIFRATVTVMTNVRHDHLEVFGPSLDGIAYALAATVPRNGLLVTADGLGLDILKSVAAKRRTRVVTVGEDDADAESLRGLPYHEYQQNLALALKTCEEVGVPRDVALKGMAKVQPDPGALGISDVQRNGKTLHFVNALAANDPDSTYAVFRDRVAGRWDCPLFVVVNTRRDRPLRSLQLGAMLGKLPATRFFLYGNDTAGVRVAALAAGVAAQTLFDGSKLKPEAFIEALVSEAPHEAAVFAIGNTGGQGRELVTQLQPSSR